MSAELAEGSTGFLRSLKICRYCLSPDANKLSDIFKQDGRFKSTASLPLQVMAIASLEACENDELPSSICTECRVAFEYCYRFSQMCKRGDGLLRQAAISKNVPQPLDRPRPPMRPNKQTVPVAPAKVVVVAPAVEPEPAVPIAEEETVPVIVADTEIEISVEKNSPKTESQKRPRILNSAAVPTPEPPQPKRRRVAHQKSSNLLQAYFQEIVNGEELDIQDIVQLDVEKDEQSVVKSTPVAINNESPTKTGGKPKLLNKSSFRVLNKDVEVEVVPRLTVPEVKCDTEGKVTVVSKVLDSNFTAKTDKDAIKNAAPIKTNVYPCPNCERSFPLEQLREIHMVTHTRKRTHPCSICDRSFFCKYDLQKHTVVHTGDKPFKCTICGNGFSRETLLQRHERVHLNATQYLCKYCEKPFITQESLDRHTQRHETRRPFKCNICDKTFAFKQGLERHEVLHSKDLPYPCQYCDESFSTAGKLARHLTAHAGKKAYPCKYCEKSYALSHHLTRHVRSHFRQTEAKGGKQSKGAYKCLVCQSKCANRDAYDAHMLTHVRTNQQCPVCNESFATNDDIVMHMKSHDNVPQTESANESDSGSKDLANASLSSTIKTEDVFDVELEKFLFEDNSAGENKDRDTELQNADAGDQYVGVQFLQDDQSVISED